MLIDSSSCFLLPPDLTPEQQKKIYEMREAVAGLLAEQPHQDTPFVLLRWLIGNNYDVEETASRFTFALETLRLIRRPSPSMSSAEDVNNFVRTINQFADYYPGGVLGVDGEGDVVYVQAAGRIHPRSLMRAGAVAELFQFTIAEADAVHALVRHQERRSGRKSGLKLIIDLDGLSTELLYAPALKIYMNALTLLQRLFPDLGKSIVVMNAPLLMNAAYAMLSSVLAEETRVKIRFISSTSSPKQQKQQLREVLGDEKLLKLLEDRTYGGLVRPGGLVPDSLIYQPSEFDNAAQMQTLSVPARSSRRIVVAGQKGRRIRWLWRVSSGDVDFHIERGSRLVWPRFRISTECCPEHDSLLCSDDDSYEFVFDNSHGRFFAKNILYRIELE